MVPGLSPRVPVVMRCAASAAIGLGHLMRCRELARLLTGQGHVCALIGPPAQLQRPEDAALFARWQPVAEPHPGEQDAEQVIALCRSMGARHLVLDDYRGDPAYQMRLRAAGLRWLQQFDASRPWDFHADVLVNAGPAERREDYRQYLKNPATETLFGPRYAVLRPEFAALPPRPDARPLRRILVSFGGGDDRGALALTLAALAGVIPGVTLVVISGSGNPRNGALQAQVAGLPPGQVDLHIDPPGLPALMATCDLAIIAGGTMSYEAAICGLPMVFIPLAPNQTRSCRGWADQTGALVLPGPDRLDPAGLRQAVLGLAAGDDTRAQMAAKGRALVDGQGAVRLLEALLGDAWVAPTLPEA